MSANIAAQRLLDTLDNLRQLPKILDLKSRDILSISMDACFSQILQTISGINKEIGPLSESRATRYLEQWNQYKIGNLPALSTPTLRHLCWNSELVCNDINLVNYLEKNHSQLSNSARAIKGLAFSLHQYWSPDLANSKLGILLRGWITNYSKRDRTISKWKADLDHLFLDNSPQIFAQKVFISSGSMPFQVCKDWNLNETSIFLQDALYYAASVHLDHSLYQKNRDYILRSLLDWIDWRGWELNPKYFKEIVTRLILAYSDKEAIEKVGPALLQHSNLGDPRLPKNHIKWIEIDEAARLKILGWLSREDILFFFDHVLKNDHQGRREFWLKYADKVVSSRPFLSPNAAIEFNDRKDKINFGNLSTNANPAVFILNFGDLIAVEFSGVGSIYMYNQAEFKECLENIWQTERIPESRFRLKKVDEKYKFRHSGNWRSKAAALLAMYGVRP